MLILCRWQKFLVVVRGMTAGRPRGLLRGQHIAEDMESAVFCSAVVSVALCEPDELEVMKSSCQPC